MRKIEVVVLVILTLVNIGILAYRAMHRAPKEPPRMVQGCFDSTDRYYTMERYR
jgi:hypothetical protein